MGSPRIRTAFIVGLVSILVLGIVWAVVLWSLPKQQEISAIESSAPPASPSHAAAPPLPPLPPPDVPAQAAPPQSPPSALSLPPEPPPRPPAPASRPTPQPSRQRPLTVVRPLEAPVEQGLSPNCMAELDKLCPGNLPGAARKQCFQENERKLSPSCQHQLEAMAVRIKESMQHFKVACETDVRQFCERVEPGEGRILQCLEENYQQVSDPCYQALRTRPFRK